MDSSDQNTGQAGARFQALEQRRREALAEIVQALGAGEMGRTRSVFERVVAAHDEMLDGLVAEDWPQEARPAIDRLVQHMQVERESFARSAGAGSVAELATVGPPAGPYPGAAREVAEALGVAEPVMAPEAGVAAGGWTRGEAATRFVEAFSPVPAAADQVKDAANEAQLPQFRVAVEHLAVAYRRTLADLRAGRWPEDVAADVARVVAHLENEVSVLDRASAAQSWDEVPPMGAGPDADAHAQVLRKLGLQR